MKKIININLSGRVIPIEDSAYEKLQAYIESLRRYFAHEDGRDEIINDIESRIAELMNEKVRKGASCVTDADIDEIIQSMGRPEDFDAEAAESNTADTSSASSSKSAQQDYTYSSKKARGRLYRDTSDKFIGGVCSGIANYLNTDPAIVRILFAIITFGGFGLGFLLYILLWMVLPTKDLDGYSGKRLFRNPDDKMIGGVAGGLAAYFNARVSTIRLIFGAPILLSILLSLLDGLSWNHGFDFFPNIVFGSLSGTFFLAYIILWIVLPEARSPYEKMEMRGEKVDVNSIRQNVQDGMGNVKDRMHAWTEEVKESAHNLGNKAKEFADSRGKRFASEVSDTAARGGRGLGHAIGVIFKVFFLFIAGTIAFALFVGLMALLFSGVAWWPINNFLWTSKWQQIYAWGTLIFFLVVPLIAFIVWVVRRVMRVRSRSSYLGWTFGFLWTIGWVAVTLLASSIYRDFSYRGNKKTAVTVAQPANGRMIVAVTAPELEYTGSFGWLNDGGDGWDLSVDTFKLSMVRFKVEKSFDSQYHVTVNKYSNGRSMFDAEQRAERIQYSVSSYDSILDIGNGYGIDKLSKYRGQHVEIEILVPEGKKIRFDRSINEKLNPSTIRIRRGNRGNDFVITDYNEYWHRFRPEVDYTMQKDGNLVDQSGTKVYEDRYRDPGYRYDDNSVDDSLEIQQQFEEEKRRNEESDRRLKELEEKRKQKEAKPATGVTESMDDEDEDVAGNGTTSVFSLVKWM